MTDDPKKPAPSLRSVQGGLEDPPKVADGIGDKPPEDRPKRKSGEIWNGCPVQALGVNGKLFFYLDILGQLQAVDNHTKDRMRAVFGGRTDLLQRHFPQFAKDGKTVTGWAQEGAATAMTRACAERGVWDAFNRVRGGGAWPAEDGGVILHCGDRVLIYDGATASEDKRRPGAIGEFVYPTAPRTPYPAEDFPSPECAELLLSTLQTWSWRRPDVDPVLLFGWICAAMFGGALNWRPLVWITGDAGTGKSTLHKLIGALMGEGALLQATDTTEAAIRQLVLQSTKPVAIDELEAEDDNRKALGVVKLARQAASGGVILRGSSDHTGHEFKARNCFMFSSILVPGLMDQDLSRLALLELEPFDRDMTPPQIAPATWGKVGRQLRRRIVDHWPRLHRTVETFRAQLAEAQHSARGCDQFGTLLAMYWVAFSDDELTPELAETWAAKLSASSIYEQMDISSDWERMLNHLLTQPLDHWKSGEKPTVGKLCIAAARLDPEPEVDPVRATNVLQDVGLKVVGVKQEARLFISNRNSALGALFAGTHWAAKGGQNGVWSQAAKRVRDAKSVVVKINRMNQRGWSIPLNLVLDTSPNPNG